MVSANQLSIYRAAADLCAEVHQTYQVLRGNLQHQNIWKRWKSLPSSPRQKILPMNSSGETYGKKQCSEYQKLSKLCSDAGLKLVEREQYFYTLETEGQQMQHSCREHTLPRNEKETRVRGWIRSKTRIGSVLNIKVCCRDGVLKFKFFLYFKATPFRGGQDCERR